MTTRRFKVLRGLVPVTLVAGMIWWAYARSVESFAVSERNDQAACALLKEQIEGARTAIEEVRKLESDAQAVRRQIDQLAQDIPAGLAATWLPELVKEHFPRFGLPDPIVRMNTFREVPDLSGFRRGYWSVGVPIAEKRPSGAGALLAVAEFEQQHPLVRVLDLVICADPENPERRLAMFNVSALVRK